MKKVVYLLLGILLILPKLVLADMSGPEVDPYKGEIINPEGAILYDYDSDKEKMVATKDKLDYGTVVYVYDDYDEDESDDWIYITLPSEEEDEDEEDESYYVSRKDIVTKEKEYKVNSKELSSEYDGVVLKKQEIKKGPANLYEGTGVILNVGAKVKVKYFQYFDEENNEYYLQEFNPWVYVEYNGTKGFINTYGSALAIGGEENEVMTGYDIELMDIYTLKPITTIKANTKFKTPVYITDIWSYDYYVKYNGKYGLVSYLYEEGKEIEFTVTDDVELYEVAYIEYDDESNQITKPIGTVKKGTTFKSKYYDFANDDCAVRYENGKTVGWILSGYEDVMEDDDGEYSWRNKVELFPYGYEEEYEDDDDDSELIDPTKPENSDPSSVTVKPGSVKTKEDRMKLVYICIACGVIVSLTAVITIVLINKNKKQKEENIQMLEPEIKQNSTEVEEKKEKEKKESKK